MIRDFHRDLGATSILPLNAIFDGFKKGNAFTDLYPTSISSLNAIFDGFKGRISKKSGGPGARTQDLTIRTRSFDHLVKRVPLKMGCFYEGTMRRIRGAILKFFNGGDVDENRHFIEGKLVAHLPNFEYF